MPAVILRNGRRSSAYRLNQLVEVYRDCLIEADAWRAVEAREVPPRRGRPIVGLDLGAERSWSAAWCLWTNGRSECLRALLLASLTSPRASDRTVLREVSIDACMTRARLIVDEGLRVSRPATLLNHLVEVGIVPDCDFLPIGSTSAACATPWPAAGPSSRGRRDGAEATEDISGFRQLVADGPLSIEPASRNLARVGMSQAIVAGDDQGSVRLQKRRAHLSRDDVAVAGVLGGRRAGPDEGAAPCRPDEVRAGRMSRAHIALDRHRWFRVRQIVLDRDNWRCRSCGRPGGPFEVDHIVPLWRHPDQDPYDARPLPKHCVKPCHADKTRGECRRERTDAELADWQNFVGEIWRGRSSLRLIRHSNLSRKRHR